MNRRIFQYIAILLIALISNGSFAQDRRTPDTKVADLLAGMPAVDLVHLDRMMGELIDMGQEGLGRLSGFLTPAGEGDDTAVRFAIASLARYASAFGRDEARQSLETALLSALEAHNDPEVKTFLLNNLNLVAADNTVNAVKKYLGHEVLTEPVTQTLLSVGSPAAALALFDALPSAKGNTAITLIKALGELRYEPAVMSVTSYLGSGDPVMQKTALMALATIGHPGSYKSLVKAARGVGFEYESTNAAEAFLIYTDRLAERGEASLTKKALKVVMKANQSDHQLHNYSEALAIFVRHYGYEAMPHLLKAVDSKNKAFRYAALNIAENMGGVAGTRQWISKAASAPDETKAEIIDMLGRRGDRLAVDFITGNLHSSSELVREDAIEALVRLQGRESVPLLIDHLANGKDIDAARNGLMQLLSQKHLAPVAARLDETSGVTKAAFIKLIAANAGNVYFNDILALTRSQNEEERKAAFGALKSISKEENLDALIDLLLTVDGKEQVKEVQLAITVIASELKAEKTEKGKLLQALEKTDKKERIIPILPETGGDAALKIITGYFNSSTGTLKETAFEALINWKDYAAAQALFEICHSSSRDYRSKAFTSFVRQVQSAGLPDDQKLLQFRKIMPYASGAADQRLVINAIGNLKTFLSLVYLEQFLDSEEVQQAAGRAIMRIALPDSQGENGFSGEKVRGLLIRVASLLKGDESEYEIININNYLNRMPREEGFVSMFNGKNLDGWQGLVGNPITRSKMSPEELAEKQKEANIKMLDNWSVRDNTIVFTGKGANLCSTKEYGDFEMIVDWRITKDGDSGIYLRGSPQVQIWDTARVDVGAQVGSGGLYNNKKHESKPLKVADNPIGEWNTFHITMIGENVTVYLNGILVTDNVPLENYWDREQPIFPIGFIELQAHGTDLAFRDIYVREINTDEIGLTGEEKAEGFVSLFNGVNLNGWQGNTTDYVAKNGELLVQPSRGSRGNLFTQKEYSDFIIRFDFLLTPGANNGLGIRTPLTGDPAYVGMELQILDDSAPVYANLKEWQYHGSVYGVIPPKRGYLKPVGEWNEQEVIVKGPRITITLNGTVILDGDIEEAGRNGTLDGRDHPGLKREKGYIGFLGHGSELKFRNIRIKE